MKIKRNENIGEKYKYKTRTVYATTKKMKYVLAAVHKNDYNQTQKNIFTITIQFNFFIEKIKHIYIKN
jgi:hypothetical protein